ncbi:hypothetical protein PRIPAC_79253 [Pristionchus pacificus]|uniref:ABC transporter ATP-binding protein n=1 Tax=Pristionchus pacificus TaxID=54126 RepID=A0A2A6CLX9_PRIPA|nr:hypothetical protein PRIPAC_79253 [Pristionchus pacificus]|eukprot:PDM79214.1 ABC transporter ATP-binding protein [Pristionchus pacificus]
MLLSPSSPSSYFLADIAVTLTLFGYYGSCQFEIRNVYESFNGYSFYSSPLDFLFIAFLRVLFYATSYQLNATEKSSLVAWLDKPTTSFFVASISFSFLKCLLFSEEKALLGCNGTFILPAWNILSAAYFYRMWSREFEACFEKAKKEEDDDDKEDLDIPITKIQQIMILAKYSYGNWPWMLVGMGVSLGTTAVNVAMPHYTSLVMNGITALREGVDINHSIEILAALTFASMILTGLNSGIFNYLSSVTVSKMRKDLFDSIINQEIAFFDKYKSGVIVSRITSDVNNVSYRISDMFTDSLKNFLTMFGKVMFMAGLSWRLTLINFIAFPIMIYISQLSGEFYEKMGSEENDVSANSHQVAEEIISTIRTVRSFGAEKRSSKRFSEAVDRASGVAKKEALASIVLHFSWDLYHNSLYVIVLMYGAKLVSEGSMDAAALVTFMMYQMEIGQGVVGLTYEIPSFMGTLGQSRKFCQFLTRKPEIETNGTVEQPVERFYDPDEGEITLDGVPVREFDHEHYHKKIALVAQEPVLYDCSVRENIGFGCDATEEEIIEAAKTANAHDFVTGLEKGYETTCGEKGTQMSGGQKQRIAIARALVRNPSILMLDEATSALDNQSEQIIQEAMQRCAGTRTVIVIAHRLTTIEKADRIAVIEKGRVVQLGSHSELLKDVGGLYHTLARAKDTIE